MKSSTFVSRPLAMYVRTLPVLAPLLSVLLWLLREKVTRAVGEQAAQLAFVSVPAVERIVDTCCAVAPLVVVAAVLMLLSRRLGRATFTADHVMIWPMGLTWPVLAIPLAEVVERRSTPHGVVLRAPTAVPRGLAWLLASLVPATTPEEVARAHAALDAPNVSASPAATASAGRVADWRDLVALVAVAVVWAFATESMRPVIGDEVLRVHALGAVLLLVLVVLSHPARTRVFLGAETLSVGGLCVAWNDVTAVAGAGPWFTLEAGRRRRAARLGEAEVARVIAFARERLARGGRGSRVQGGAPRWRVRRSLALSLLALGVASLAVVAGPVRYRTAEACLVLVADVVHHEHWAAIVYRKFDGAPQLVVITDGVRPHAVRGPSRWSERHDAWVDQSSYDLHSRLYPFGKVDVDARLGVVTFGQSIEFESSFPPGATIVHWRGDGVSASVTPLGQASPTLRELAHADTRAIYGGWELLAACLPEVQDPVLRDALDGVTSARCWEVGPTFRRLLARVDHGRLACAVIASDVPYQAYQCLACVVADGPPRLVRIGGRRTGAGTMGDADLPTLAEVRDALVAVERGASVASATATWPRAVSR